MPLLSLLPVYTLFFFVLRNRLSGTLAFLVSDLTIGSFDLSLSQGYLFGVTECYAPVLETDDLLLELKIVLSLIYLYKTPNLFFNLRETMFLNSVTF
jgi:hypothetical protein